jgi:hypothetical protein
MPFFCEWMYVYDTANSGECRITEAWKAMEATERKRGDRLPRRPFRGFPALS